MGLVMASRRVKLAEKPAPTVKRLHIGRCLARCKSCGTGPCRRCEEFTLARTVGGYDECVCGHSQQIHAVVEVKA